MSGAVPSPLRSTPSLGLAEILGVFARAGDLGRGQAEGHVEQVCWIGMRLAQELDLAPPDRDDVYFTTLLVHGGCTAGMAEFAAFIASDELSAQRDLCLCDPENLAQVMGCMKQNIACGAPLPARASSMLRMTGGDRMLADVQAGCADVGSRIASRLGLPSGAVTALGCVCETWSGRGPRRLERSRIPIAARVAHTAMVAAVFYREGGRPLAVEAVQRRAGKSLDPDVARAFGALEGDASFWDELESTTLAHAISALEPARPVPTGPPSLDAVVLALADFVDLKSKRTAAHSRRTAELAERMAHALGASNDEATLCRRAGLVHDLGQVGVPAFILDQPTLAPLERAQLELHPELTGHVLSRLPALAEVAQVAVAHHERLDGSGYPHRLSSAALPRAARLLAVADAYDERVRGTEGRAPLTPGEAQRALEAEAGIRFDRDCVRALGEVLADTAKPAMTEAWPAGLTEREVEVLRLAALGLTLKEIARDLSLSPHTARHHLEHVYEKIGVSSRAGAALFAVEHGLVE